MAGRLIHFEIPARDRERAKRFWGSLFEWKFNDWEGTAPYTLIEASGEPNGGMYETESPLGRLIVYFDVDDMDASVARVRELGGEAEDKQPIPGIGWFAGCRDSEGNAFSLFETDESVQAPG
ncbi:MAG: VOC family protein [Actinomycetota bacterium]|nr:VOC family protein [Actinomycetota bacterium]